ncbi:hypothetical protein [Mediterranea massiliensis]|uniref:hypothetical protein n=1 Tax=Mediterranea massiliensis TaxID=1841865 RepID=UPI0025A3B5A0|nr:hypothetical protein [Mediterranea massiliensis]MDM8336916.1 hypothetical protein [Mediterranea massiliensis]
MKDLNEFKAFALSKAQMNALAGGSIYCQSADDDRDIVFSDGIEMADAQAAAELAFGGDAICEEEIRV